MIVRYDRYGTLQPIRSVSDARFRDWSCEDAFRAATAVRYWQ